MVLIDLLILQQVELTFQTGNEIYVYGDMDDDGFYMGELNGVRGLVPSNFLTEAPGQNQGQPPPGSRRPGGQSQGPGARGPPPPPREPPPAGHRRGKGKQQLSYRFFLTAPITGACIQLLKPKRHRGSTMLCFAKRDCSDTTAYFVL